MAAVKFTIEVQGLKELKKKLDPPHGLYAEPVRQAFDDVAELGEALGIRAAPIGPTGSTIARFQRKVQKKEVPLWAVVKTTARREGFAYPRVVNYSPYAQSRYHKGVNKHRYWFDNAMNRARAYMGQILEKAADEVERRWLG